jgi:hypothetical protein
MSAAYLMTDDDLVVRALESTVSAIMADIASLTMFNAIEKVAQIDAAIEEIEAAGCTSIGLLLRLHLTGTQLAGVKR